MNKKTQHTPQIKPAQGRRLQRLLDMEYQPSEIAEETGIPLKTIYRSHIPAGLPVRQDSNGRIWIHGVTYRNWVRAILTTYAEKPREKLGAGEFYCAHCKARVTGIDVSLVAAGNQRRLTGTCPDCKTSLTKFTAKGNTHDPA